MRICVVLLGRRVEVSHEWVHKILRRGLKQGEGVMCGRSVATCCFRAAHI